MSCQTASVNPNRYEIASAEDKAHFKKVLLPLPAGTKFKISQGAFGNKSHNEPGNEYSWDFDVPYGTAVTAVEDGKVIDIWEPNGAGGCDPKLSDSAHNLKIEHTDGTVAQYVHIRSAVKLGQLVHAGQVIATTEKMVGSAIPNFILESTHPKVNYITLPRDARFRCRLLV